MSTTYSDNLSLPLAALGDSGWGQTLLDLFAILDALAPIAAGYVRATETPSTTLRVNVGAAKYRKSDGSQGTFAGATNAAVAASSTTSIYLTNAGSIVYSTTGFPAATAIVRLATVVTDSSKVTSITDERAVLGVST